MSLAVSGPFGLPTNVISNANVVGDIYLVGQFVDYIVVQFDFAATPSLPSPLSIEFSVDIEEWWGYCYNGGGQMNFLLLDPTPAESGTLYGDLPTRVGDSAPLRRIPVGVESRPWSVVKQLYR